MTCLQWLWLDLAAHQFGGKQLPVAEQVLTLYPSINYSLLYCCAFRGPWKYAEKLDTIFEALCPFVLLVAHSDVVTSVASCPGKDTVFLSCAEVKLILCLNLPNLTLVIYS